MNETLKSVELLIEADLARSVANLQAQLDAGQIGQIGFGEDQSALRADAEKKVHDLREAFEIASKGEIKERVSCVSVVEESVADFPLLKVVPDHLVDGITFEVMHDPVITPSGTSFDRIGIVKYVEKAGVDPITRVPMTVKDLRPNYALKAACAEFLENNGWAVDW